jgi:hypothetical protein
MAQAASTRHSRLDPSHNLHTEQLRALAGFASAAPHVYEGNEDLRQAPRWLAPRSDAEPLTPSSGVGQNRFSPGTDSNHRRSLATQLSLEQHILPSSLQSWPVRDGSFRERN